jgi:hypothetical protein
MTTEFPWGAGVIAWADPTATDPDPAGTLCLSRQSGAWADEWPTITTPVQPTMHDPDAVVRYHFLDEGSVDPLVALGDCHADAAMLAHNRSWSGTNIYPGFGVIAIDSVARFDWLLVIDSP